MDYPLEGRLLFKILKGGRVFAPNDMGIMDVLIAGNVVGNIAQGISPSTDYGNCEIVDATGRYVVPGFIDQHVHLIGGGGEAGYASRTPEVLLSHIVRSGITTVVGCLGTDGTTRHMTSLLAKARGLEIEGVSTYIYTGSYEVPTRTITGNVRNDIILIDKVLGCGEIAISDHRSAQPSREDIEKLVAEARVGGILSGKAGVLHLHVGDGQRGLSMLFEIINETEIPITQFTPTHINRNPHLLEDGIRFALLGGMIDITSGLSPDAGATKGVKPSKAVKYCLDKGVPIENITMSSDGNGSMPLFDNKGYTIGLLVAELDSLYREFRDMINNEGIEISDALRVMGENQARSLNLYPKKGCLQTGSDADILVLDDKLNIEHVLAQGRTMVRNGEVVVTGTFE